MAVRIGNGRYYKLFSGSSQLKRLFIDDISEPGMLEEEYIQGKLAFLPETLLGSVLQSRKLK